MISKIKEIIKIFNTDLELTEEKSNKELKRITIYIIVLGFIMALITVPNIKTSSLMAICSAISAVVCFVVGIMGWIFKNRKIPSIVVSLLLMFLFSVCVIKGGNEGFVTIWIAILPSVAMLAHGLRHGTFFSLYFAVFLFAMFMTPLRVYLQYDYSEMFLKRFPILYLVSFISSFAGLLSLHKTALDNEAQRKELEELRIKAEDANRAKSTFLATMSHEIRTPINGILGMNTIMINECKDESMLAYAYNVQRSGNTLLSIVNDILDISKIESGKMSIIPVKYKLFNVLYDCYNMTLPRTRDKGLKLILEVDENLPSVLIGDEIRIRQVLNNILSNAAKYTKKGFVKLKLDGERIEENKVKLVISISDSGIGIKEEDIGRLFDSFTRLDEKSNRNIEGTGLGLNLTKKLVQMMQGTINVSSEYGKGSTFTIELLQDIDDNEPIGNFNERYDKEINKSNVTDKFVKIKDTKILVVDDVEINLLVAEGLLKRTGAEVYKARSGQECLDMLDNKDYDIVFLDHMMPEMDGIETLAMFKSVSHEHNNETPIIMLTANAIEGAKEEYLEAGFIDYLSKPIMINELNEILMKYLPDGKVKQE